MPYYNLTPLYNATGIYTLVEASNTYSGGILATGFCIATFIIALIPFTFKVDFEKALLGASFPAFFLSATLSYVDLVSMFIPAAFLTIMAFSGAFILFRK